MLHTVSCIPLSCQREPEAIIWARAPSGRAIDNFSVGILDAARFEGPLGFKLEAMPVLESASVNVDPISRGGAQTEGRPDGSIPRPSQSGRRFRLRRQLATIFIDIAVTAGGLLVERYPRGGRALVPVRRDPRIDWSCGPVAVLS